MLVVIVSIFLLVNLPQALFMGLLCLDKIFQLPALSALFDGSFPTIYLLTNNMLLLATYPVNFAICCSMSTQFRVTFKLIFCGAIDRARRSSTRSGAGSTTQLSIGDSA